MARPTVMTPEVINKLEEAFAWGCTDREACLWAGIDSRTLYLYQDKHPEFIQRKEDLKDTPVMLARKTVVNAIKKGDRVTSMQYLERKKKDEFSLRQEMTGKDGKDLPTPIITLEGDSVRRDNSNPQD